MSSAQVDSAPSILRLSTPIAPAAQVSKKSGWSLFRKENGKELAITPLIEKGIYSGAGEDDCEVSEEPAVFERMMNETTALFVDPLENVFFSSMAWKATKDDQGKSWLCRFLLITKAHIYEQKISFNQDRMQEILLENKIRISKVHSVLWTDHKPWIQINLKSGEGMIFDLASFNMVEQFKVLVSAQWSKKNVGLFYKSVLTMNSIVPQSDQQHGLATNAKSMLLMLSVKGVNNQDIWQGTNKYIREVATFKRELYDWHADRTHSYIICFQLPKNNHLNLDKKSFKINPCVTIQQLKQLICRKVNIPHFNDYSIRTLGNALLDESMPLSVYGFGCLFDYWCLTLELNQTASGIRRLSNDALSTMLRISFKDQQNYSIQKYVNVPAHCHVYEAIKRVASKFGLEWRYYDLIFNGIVMKPMNKLEQYSKYCECIHAELAERINLHVDYFEQEKKKITILQKWQTWAEMIVQQRNEEDNKMNDEIVDKQVKDCLDDLVLTMENQQNTQRNEQEEPNRHLETDIEKLKDTWEQACAQNPTYVSQMMNQWLANKETTEAADPIISIQNTLKDLPKEKLEKINNFIKQVVIDDRPVTPVSPMKQNNLQLAETAKETNSDSFCELLKKQKQDRSLKQPQNKFEKFVDPNDLTVTLMNYLKNKFRAIEEEGSDGVIEDLEKCWN